MIFLALTVTLIGMHFLVYILWLRNGEALKSEKGIFAYHFWFALACSSMAAAMSAIDLVSVAQAAAAIAMNGIYSLSFLELWSLSQGSYSVSMLIFGKQRCIIAEADLASFTGLGDAKLHARLDALLRLALITVSQDRIQLTFVGRAVAAVLAALAWLSNIERTG